MCVTILSREDVADDATKEEVATTSSGRIYSSAPRFLTNERF